MFQDDKSNGVAKPQPRVPQPKARVVPPPPTTKAKDDYLGDVDLPSASESESESEGEERHKPIYTAEEKDRTFNSMVCSLAPDIDACSNSRAPKGHPYCSNET